MWRAAFKSPKYITVIIDKFQAQQRIMSCTCSMLNLLTLVLQKNWDNLEVSNDLFLLSDPDCPGSLEIQSYAILFTVSTQLLPNFTLCRVLDLGLVK